MKTLFETKFIRLFDLQYEEGKHYFTATRRKLDDLMAIKSDEEFKVQLPDAVTCTVIVRTPDEEPRLVLFYEYRYPMGQFLLSPTAGLIDEKDKLEKEPLLSTARREIFEETGIVVKDTDRLEVLSPLVFSTPGMTDESNGLVLAVVDLPDLSSLNQNGAEGTECFNGFQLLTKKEAMEIIKAGRDPFGNFFSAFTWQALLYFAAGLWEQE